MCGARRIIALTAHGSQYLGCQQQRRQHSLPPPGASISRHMTISRSNWTIYTQCRLKVIWLRCSVLCFMPCTSYGCGGMLATRYFIVFRHNIENAHVRWTSTCRCFWALLGCLLSSACGPSSSSSMPHTSRSVCHLTHVSVVDVCVTLQRFEWPTRSTWLYLLANSLIGTVLSEVLWLWATLVPTLHAHYVAGPYLFFS